VPKLIVIISALSIFFSGFSALGSSLSVDGQPPEEITKLQISTNDTENYQPNSVMLWTQSKRSKPIRIYVASANEAMELKAAISSSSVIYCETGLQDTCSSYKVSSQLNSEITPKVSITR